jgi:16S rRNA (adenine1518-N6/adenine1519-N6)-dimethyltransferase
MAQKGARLGQHFLTNPHYAEVLVREAGITGEDAVLEIGPGEGMLTREILKVAKHVIVVEKDELLAQKLHDTFSSDINEGKLEVLSADIRDIEPEKIGLETGKYVLAANIPYYITGELLRKFLETSAQPKTIVFLMQKEVADRILARDGKESILSISVKVYGTPRIAAKVSRGNFNPPPSVDSAILVVGNISKENFSDVNEEDFFKAVRAGFSSKRKLLESNLAKEFGREIMQRAVMGAHLPQKARAEDISLEEWKKVAKGLSQS